MKRTAADARAEGKEVLFISFNGRQIAIQSDLPAAIDFVSAVYKHMLVPHGEKLIGTIDVGQERGGFVVRPLGAKASTSTRLEALHPQVIDDVLMIFMKASPELLWFHAGVVEKAQKALIVPAPSGWGKSTITSMLVHRGWRYMSDDVAPVCPLRHTVLSFPLRGERRVYPGARKPASEAGLLEREVIEYAPEKVQREPMPLGGIIFPAFEGQNSTTLTEISPGDASLQLLSNLRNFKELKGDAVSTVVAMSRETRSFQLNYTTPEAGDQALSSPLLQNCFLPGE